MKNKIAFLKRIILGLVSITCSFAVASACDQALDTPIHKIEIVVKTKGEITHVQLFDLFRENKKPIFEEEFIVRGGKVKVLRARQDYLMNRIKYDELPKSELRNFDQLVKLNELLGQDAKFVSQFGYPNRIHVTNAHRSFLIGTGHPSKPGFITTVILDKLSLAPKRVFVYEDIDDEDEVDEVKKALQGVLDLTHLIWEYASSFEEPVVATQAEIDQLNLDIEKELAEEHDAETKIARE